MSPIPLPTPHPSLAQVGEWIAAGPRRDALEQHPRLRGERETEPSL